MSARACACVCAFFQSNGSKGMSRLGARCLFDSLYLPADCQHTHTRTHTHSNVSIQAFSLLNVRQDQLLTCWDVSHVFTPSLPENTDRPDHIKKKSSSPLLSSVKPQDWRHPAAGSLQPHSWLLFAGRQRCSVHTEAAGGLATKHFETLAALSHRTRITITFIIRQQNESTGPKTRPVPAAWPIACHYYNCCILQHHNVKYNRIKPAAN